MRMQKVESTFKFGKQWSFLYPDRGYGKDFARIRQEGRRASFIPGSSFDGYPTHGQVFDETVRVFGIQNGDPVLDWLGSCFSAARARRISKKIKAGIDQAAREYRKGRRARETKATFLAFGAPAEDLIPVATCQGCGCRDDRACPGGCAWVAVNRAKGMGICTNCAGRPLGMKKARKGKKG